MSTQRFGEYLLIAKVGEGRMAEVWSARRETRGHPIALKRIKPGYLRTVADIQRFRLELQKASRLDHENIIKIHETGEQGGQYYFTMDRANGGSLAEQVVAGRWSISTENSLESQRMAARLMATIARAVHYAHQQGVMHGNLKPSDIVLDEDDVPHVTDFGLAQFLHEDDRVLPSGSWEARACYVAPENAPGKNGPSTVATDVYGLGLVLYELLTGRPAFQAEGAAEATRMVPGEPARPGTHIPYLDRGLEYLCLRCLEKDPANRPASAEEVATQLEQWLSGKRVSRRNSHTSSGVIGRAPRRFARAALWTVLLAGCIAAVIAGTSGQWRRFMARTESAPAPVLPVPPPSRNEAPAEEVVAKDTAELQPSSEIRSNESNETVPVTTNLTLARVESREDKFKGAVQTMLSTLPTNSSMLATFGQSIASDSPWMAEALVGEAVRLNPADLELRQLFASLLKENGKPAQALEVIDSALMVGTNGWNHQLRRLQGVILEELGQSEKALEAFSAALDIVATDAGKGIPDTVRVDYLQRRAKILKRLGRDAQARKDLFQARIPSRRPGISGNALDLSPYFNSTLVEGEHDKGRDKPTGNNLAALLTAVVRLDDIEFDVRGIIQLSNGQIPENPSGFPRAVEQIRIDRPVAQLHMLHGTVWPAPARTTVARVIIRYSDGERVEVPIIYGLNVQELIYDPSSPAPVESAKSAWNREENGVVSLTGGKSRQAVWKLDAKSETDWKLIWYGGAESRHPLWTELKAGQSATRRWGVRLYQMAWVNHRRQSQVSSMDFVSAQTASAPFLVAVTAE